MAPGYLSEKKVLEAVAEIEFELAGKGISIDAGALEAILATVREVLLSGHPLRFNSGNELDDLVTRHSLETAYPKIDGNKKTESPPRAASRLYNDATEARDRAYRERREAEYKAHAGVQVPWSSIHEEARRLPPITNRDLLEWYQSIQHLHGGYIKSTHLHLERYLCQIGLIDTQLIATNSKRTEYLVEQK